MREIVFRGPALHAPPGTSEGESVAFQLTATAEQVLGDSLPDGRYYFAAAVPMQGRRVHLAAGEAVLRSRSTPTHPEARQDFDFTSARLAEGRPGRRLAALLGRRDEALDAYRTYLAFRSDPEPAVAVEVEQVQAALQRLVGEALDARGKDVYVARLRRACHIPNDAERDGLHGPVG